MKKALFIIVVMLVIIPSMVFAVKLSPKAKNEIITFQNFVKNMDSSQKMFYYNQYEKGVTAPLLLNILVGLGVGSFVEGDTVGGTTALVGDILSALIFYGGYASVYTAAMNEDDSGLAASGTLSMIAGMLGMIGFRIYEIVRPIVYTKEYNRQLSNAMNGVSFGMVPVLDENDGMKLALTAKFTF